MFPTNEELLRGKCLIGLWDFSAICRGKKWYEGLKLEHPGLRLWSQQEDANAWESMAPLWPDSAQILPWMKGVGNAHPLSFLSLCQGLLDPVLISMAARSHVTVAPSALDLYLPFWVIYCFFIPTPLPQKPYFC